MSDDPKAPPGLKLVFRTSGEILPNNDRTEKLMEIRLQEEARRKKEEEEKAILQEKEKKEKRKRDENKQRDKEQKEKMKAEEERKAILEKEERSRLKGKTNIISERLQKDISPSQYSLSGIEFDTKNIEIICIDLIKNQSLRCLHISRKRLTDKEGELLAKMLNKNVNLLKLELPGNLFGPKTAMEFGKALKENKTLRFLDLEDNFLTDSGTSNDEVKALADCLAVNQDLLHLNLANNGMKEDCGEKFVNCTNVNTNLICFEFGMNNFSLEQTREIQDNLRRNKKAYDDERFMEWKERKLMAEEERSMKILDTVQEKDRIMQEEAELSRIAREKAREAAWNEFIMESELERQRLIQRLEEAAKMRKGKKKGKKGKKKKKS
eukprot:CAMPEP_0196994748 /NCGR_PEP_ID=MMETSP1380-20130617/1001_1 /TAXON_ID=5936 /ORGANISM="Euplotes crassus, Strain CT5" /LENGTH=379 /DNA_ID=CAMNT_0042410209 /DNA_START=9 /DNA_END=1148 /DNA_ORIENTATION=-